MSSTPIIRELQVVGLYFRDADTKSKVRGLVGGTFPAKFVPEPSNAHDPLALAVYLCPLPGSEWLHVGYVPASVSPLLLLWLTIPEPFSAQVFVKQDKQLPALLLSVNAK